MCSSFISIYIQLPIDDELGITGPKSLPQTIIAFNLDWNILSIGYKCEVNNWFDTMKRLPDSDHNLPFDEYKEYLHTHKMGATFA